MFNVPPSSNLLACIFSLGVLLAFSAENGYAQVPRLINYQGSIARGGSPVNGSLMMTFTIYADENRESALWTSGQREVQVTNGRFSILLGQEPQPALPPDLFSGSNRFIGVQVEGSEFDVQRLASTAYALRASVAEQVAPGSVGPNALVDDAAVISLNDLTGPITLETAGGASIARDGNTLTITAGSGGGQGIQSISNTDGALDIENRDGSAQINIEESGIDASMLAPDAAVKSLNGWAGALTLEGGTDISVTGAGENVLQISFTGDLSGDITGVTAGDGLTGGGQSGNVELSIAGGGVTTNRLANNAVNSAKIDNGTVTRADLANNAVGAAELAAGTAVTSLNGLDDAVTLTGGDNVTLEESGNTITISAAGSGGGGDITGVAAGAGLSGGGDSGGVTLAILDGGVTATMLADNAVGAAELAPGAAVTSLNGLSNGVNLAAGDNIALAEDSNTITISATGGDGDGGDITEVTAGTGLTGGGETGSVTLGVAPGGIGTDQLTDGAVTGAKLAPGAAVTTLEGVSGGIDLTSSDGSVTINPSPGQIDLTTAGGGGTAGVQSLNGLEGGITLDGGGPVSITENPDTGVITISHGNDENDDVESLEGLAGILDLTSDDGTIEIAANPDGTIDLAVNNTTFSSQPSSRRWKENIEPLEQALALVERLEGVRFQWKESGRADIGLIAEEVAEVVPEVVAYEDGQAQGVNYGHLVALLVEAVKTQQQQIEARQDALDAQQAQIDTLTERLKRLERLVSNEQ